MDDKTQRSPEDKRAFDEFVREMFEHKISFNEFLGFQVEKLDKNEALVGFDMKPELVGHYLYGRLHGGVISSVLDVVGGLAVMMAIEDYHQDETAMQVIDRFKHLGTVDLRVDYLRQGVGERFTASANVVRLGKRIASTHMELTNQEDKLIATGSATYIVS
ncbi:MAG: thioesterase family protein [Granulosicoccaceae bacterium]